MGAGTHRCVLGQVRQRGVLGLVVGLIVPARTVVQINGSGTVLVLDLLGILTGTGHLGTLVQRLGAEGEANGAELVELVIVGDGVGALWLHEHGLIRLTLRIGARQGCEFHRLDVGTALGLGDARPIDLGETVELRDLTGDDDALTCGVGTGGLGGVDEDAVGGIGRGLGHTTSSGGLDVETIEPALGVGGGDDARGGHSPADHRAGVGGALDVGDARLAGRGLGGSGGRRTARGGAGRLVRSAWRAGSRCAGGVHRAGSADDEVRRVVVGVLEATPLGRGGVRQCLGRFSLGLGGGTVADEVDDRAVRADQLHRSLGATHVGTAGGIRGGQCLGTTGSLGLLDEEVTAGTDRPAQRAPVAAIAGGSVVLHDVPVQRDRLGGGIDELDEVVGEGGSTVATATVDLIDE